MEPILEVQGLQKRYGDQTVLTDVTFTIETGAFVLLTGRSGSGKSTLFKLLAGLDRPDAGTIRLAGTDLAALDDRAISDARLHRIGLVFQSFNLLPDLTLQENVRLPMDIRGAKRHDAQERSRELLDLVGVAHLAERLPNEVSGGEAQRAAIARSLANEPEILMADEPTGNLDRKNAENVLDVFEDVNRTLGTTILMITHDPLTMARVPDRLEVEDGRVRWGSAKVSVRSA